MEPLSAQLLKRINNPRTREAGHVDLAHLELREISDELIDTLLERSNVKSIDFSSNRITVVPDRLLLLSELESVQLHRNPIEQMPDLPGVALDIEVLLRCRAAQSMDHVIGLRIGEATLESDVLAASKRWFGRLINLRSLEIGVPIQLPADAETQEQKCVNFLAALDRRVDGWLEVASQSDRLKNFYMFGVPLRRVPSALTSVASLESVTLCAVWPSTWPEELFELPALRQLDLGHNSLAALPPATSRASALTRFDARFNALEQFPQAVLSMKELWSLNLGGNRITSIPQAVVDLKRLDSLQIDAERVETPPPEVVQDGIDAIRAYWRQQSESGTDFLCEAKLLIVGEPGAGKTTLANKILDPDYQLNPDQPTTEGIDVARWSYPAAVRARRDGNEQLVNTTFQANVWDFGGQEIYHATHQFFLTRRSLYVLVVDDRKEDTDFDYWLNVIELLSDSSPLLIVHNEKHDRQRVVDESALRARFPNLRDHLRLNLATNRGLADAVERIRNELQSLPHIGTPLPATWRQVRDALEEDDRDHVPVEEFKRICGEHGFERDDDKLQLSSYLHDLGICLHFQDDPLLSKTVFLRPKWGTDAVYRVLDDPEIRARSGRFGPSCLKRVWSEPAYAAMRDELVQLMMRFQLCYRIPGTDEFIAPQLLSPTRPKLTHSSGQRTLLRYDYDFMPKGIITRFTVALHELIQDQRVWRSGVVLERDGCRAEVIEDHPRRRIEVRLIGTDPRPLLAIVDWELDKIHRSYPQLRFDQLLPRRCETCIASPAPYLFRLLELQDFARTGDQIQCRSSRQLVDAAQLIAELLPPQRKHPSDGSEVHAAREPEPAPRPRREVFVSYSGSNESPAMVDQIQHELAQRGIDLIRDRDEIRYKDSISQFMRRMGQGKAIVVILSRAYLESKYCMFELAEIAERGEFRERVFPVILEDANVFDGEGRLDYIEHWEEKKAKLEQRTKKVGLENLEGITEDINLYARIRATIDGLMDTLGDMKTLSPGQQRDSQFEELCNLLHAKLDE